MTPAHYYSFGMGALCVYLAGLGAKSPAFNYAWAVPLVLGLAGLVCGVWS